jgi:Ion transport protein
MACLHVGHANKSWANHAATVIITSTAFEIGSIIVIILNSILLAMQDPVAQTQADYLETSATVFLYLYSFEFVVKVLSMGFIMDRGSYLRDPWNILDFIIVVSGYLPMFIDQQGGNSINFSGLRSLRVLRPLRTITAIRSLGSIISTIIVAIPYLMEIMFVIVFVFLIFSITALQLFSGLLLNNCYDALTGHPYTDQYGNSAVLCSKNSCPTVDGMELTCGKQSSNPDWGTSNFDNIANSFLMVYVIVTQEGWTAIMYYVQLAFNYWLSMYFLLLMFIGSFVLIELLMAVITIKFNESNDNSKAEELAIAKHDNDDFFKILPLPSLPRVKNLFKEGVSLTRMRANKDFFLNRITKLDTITNPFKEAADPTVTVKAYKEIKHRSKVEIRKYEVQTFDDTHDWRKMKGDLFTGDVMKKAIQIYTPTTKAIKNEWLKRSETKIAKTSRRNQVVPLFSSSEDRLKPSSPREHDQNTPDGDSPGETYRALAEFDPVVNLRTFDIEENKTEVENHLQELVNMTSLQGAELNRYCTSITKKQAQERMKAANTGRQPKEGVVNIPPQIKQTAAETIHDNINSKPTANLTGKKYLESITENEFPLSDEEGDNIKVPKDLKQLTNMIMSNNKVRTYLRRFVRKWKKEQVQKELRTYDTFNDLRMDEDFINVAGVKLMGPITEKKPSAVPGLTLKTPEQPNKANNIQSGGSKDLVTTPAIKPGKEVAHPKLGLSIGEQLDNADIGDRSPPYQNEPLKDPKSGADPSSKANDELIINEQSLLDNEAFKGLIDVLKNDGLRKFDDSVKKEANRKKKKALAEDDDEDSDGKQDPKILEEEALANYYKSKDYEFLKIEASYQYNIIPSPAFSSIFDILPYHTMMMKNQQLADTKAKQKASSNTTEAAAESISVLPMEYNMVELKQQSNKQKKKKRPQDSEASKQSNSGGLDSSSKLQSNSALSDDSGDLSAFSSDDQSSQNRIMSENKEKRIKWLETNDKYIIQKPFPLMISSRKDHILTHMSYDPYRAAILAQNSSVTNASSLGSVAAGSKKNRSQTSEFIPEFESVNEFFKTDNYNDKKDLKEYRFSESKPDYLVLYQKVKSMDMEEGKIIRYNWSANQVVSTRQFTLSQTFKALDSLNKRIMEIWMHNYSGLWATIRRYCRELVEDSNVNILLMLCVFFNTLMMASDGLTPESWADAFGVLNYIFVTVFTFESALKILGYPFKVFAKDTFNVFDAIIVCISLVEVAINLFSTGGGGGGALKAVRIFRIFRVFRVTRLLRSLRFMKVLIEVIRGTLEQFAYIAILLFLFIFIFTLLGTQIFGGQFTFIKPTDYNRYNFDTFGNAFYTTFDVLTIENWNNILQSVLRSQTNTIIGLAYLLAWIFIGNYIFLNLILAVLLDGFDSSDTLTMVDELETESKELTATYQRLVKDIREKARNEENNSKQANKQLMMIIEPGKHRDAAAIKKNQACYVILRDDAEDNASLEEAVDIEKRLEAKFMTQNIKMDPFKDVDCIRSLYFLEKTNPFRKICAIIVSHPTFETFILTLIIFGSLKLMVETYLDLTVDSWINTVFGWIDNFFTVAFIVEMLLKVIRNGFFVANSAYLKDSWSILDFVIVSTSILDLAVQSINLPFLRVLRLLRTLRPLRVISKNQSMKILVNALFESLVAILNVLVVILMIWIMFAILGMNMMQDKMGYCSVPNDSSFDFHGVSKDQCINVYGGQWNIYDWNYDNIINALISLFILSTMESWPDQLASALDANDASIGPIYMGSPYNGVFFVVFILVGSFFLMNLFVGVIFVQFSDEQQKEKESKFYMVTDDQMRWIMIQDMIATAEPTFDILIRPKGKVRLWIFKLILSKAFEVSLMGCIILNIIVLSMAYETMSLSYSNTLKDVNLVFSIIFILESTLKIAALDFQYFKFGWNVFDFIIVFISILDILLDTVGGSISFLKSAPQYARVLRVLRVSRLFKLMKSKQFEGVNKIFKTLFFSLPILMNVMVLLLLAYFIFAVLGVFLFKGAPPDQLYNNDVFNFNDFHHAFLTLFRCSTGENWPTFMFFYSNQPGAAIYGRVFWVFFVFFASMVMLKVFQLVVMQQFEEFYFNTVNPLNSFNDLSETFRSTWNLFTIKSRGTKIKASRLTEIREPLGYRVKDDSDDEDIAEMISSKKKIKTAHGYDRFTIAQHINSWGLQK